MKLINETSHLFCSANQMTGFSMKCNTGLKWVHPLSANPTKWSNKLKQFNGFSCIGCIIRTPFPRNNSIDWFPYEKVRLEKVKKTSS